jgi:uncharacterized protein (TIGR02284 family)
MFPNREHDISVLNDLITTTIDSADGFERSADNVKGTELERMFSEFARERRQIVGRFQQHVRSELRGDAADDGSMTAAMHRRFEDLRTAFGGGDKAVIEEVERGEDHIKAKYQAALKDEKLDGECRALIAEAFESIKAGHDRASLLKHSLQGA